MLSHLQIQRVCRGEKFQTVLEEIWGFEGFRGYLEKTSEDVELKDRAVVDGQAVDFAFYSSFSGGV